jgi:arylsulfatase A-like enzyme
LRRILGTVALASLAVWAHATPLPNVVLVVVDDLGWSDLGCYGSDLHATPHIDRLSQQGVRFTNAYAAAAICSPTRAALMTGKYPARLGMTIWHEAAARGPNPDERLLPPRAEANLSLQEITLAERLLEAGYATLHVGKWHLGDAYHYPETQGFESNVGGTLWGAPATYFWPYRGPFDDEIRYIPGLSGEHRGQYLTDRLCDEAIKLIATAGARPFFLNLWFHSVHTPIEGKPELVRHYQQQVASHPHTRHRNPDYAAMVHCVDQNIGRLLRHLDELGLADNTVVLVTSDNGGVVNKTNWGYVTTNAPLRSGKGSLYEGGIRVPLLVRWPRVTPAGSLCHEPVISCDLNVTIRQLAGLESSTSTPSNDDGVSLLHLLAEPTGSLHREAIFWHYPHYYPTTTPVSAVRAGRHKLLRFYEDQHHELYDLLADEAEQHDLAEAQPELTQRLINQLDRWIQQVGARLPTAHPQRR